jgi:transposase
MIETGVSAYVYRQTVDMRIGFDRLACLVREQIGQSPRAPSLFVFFSRHRDKAKVLWHDGTGYCILCKRLDSGRFESMKRVDDDGKCYVVMNAAQMRELLSGVRGKPATQVDAA